MSIRKDLVIAEEVLIKSIASQNNDALTLAFLNYRTTRDEYFIKYRSIQRRVLAAFIQQKPKKG